MFFPPSGSLLLILFRKFTRFALLFSDKVWLLLLLLNLYCCCCLSRSCVLLWLVHWRLLCYYRCSNCTLLHYFQEDNIIFRPSNDPWKTCSITKIQWFLVSKKFKEDIVEPSSKTKFLITFYWAAKNKIKEFVRLPNGTCIINLDCIPD